MKFVASFFDRDDRYSLGVEEQSSTAYLSIPVSNSAADYEEYYALSDHEYAAYATDREKARAFAEQCRRHEHDDRLIQKPGWSRGTPR
ncbi:hypothetical protein [Agromyces sp. Marseille-Q5079]|uniref:hypothetical protein n=1 Tax=Agromyces sp. Marseille-Q5079 TaxID=3439059 RepID=UPI003D9C9DC1